MSTRFYSVFVLACGFAALSILVGCNPSAEKPAAEGGTNTAEAEDDYNPHDVPITEQQKAELHSQTAQFTDAVTAIKQFRNEIEQETAAGIPANPYMAHQALDKADLVLQWLPEIARNSGVAKENWEAVNTAANELRTLFEQVHQNIDTKQNPDFAAVANPIDEKLAALEQIASNSSSDAG
jgi:hypothetical protein